MWHYTVRVNVWNKSSDLSCVCILLCTNFLYNEPLFRWMISLYLSIFEIRSCTEPILKLNTFLDNHNINFKQTHLKVEIMMLGCERWMQQVPPLHWWYRMPKFSVPVGEKENWYCVAVVLHIFLLLHLPSERHQVGTYRYQCQCTQAWVLCWSTYAFLPNVSASHPRRP